MEALTWSMLRERGPSDCLALKTGVYTTIPA